MHKNATKCNKILSKWCKNKHGASKIIDTFETYQVLSENVPSPVQGQSLEIATKWADEWGMSVKEVLTS
jgi:hypothetical protein